MNNSVSRGLLSLLLVMAFVTIAVSPFGFSTVRAQDNACPLAPEDCELLASAGEALRDLRSVNLKSFSLELAGGTGEQQSSLSVTGFGPIVFNDGSDGVVVDLTFTDAALTTPNQSQSGPGAFRIVDNGVYVGSGEGDAIEWQGSQLDSEDLQSRLNNLGINLENLRDFRVLDALVSLNTLPGAVTWSRGEDMTLEDGRSVAVYSFDLDLAVLTSSQDFINALTQALVPLTSQLGGEGGLFSDPSSIAIFVRLLLTQLSDQLSASTAQLSVWVSPEDSQIYGLTSAIDVNLDLSFLSSFMSNSGGSAAPSETNFTLNFESVWAEHNGEFSIEPPAEFEPLDTSGLDFNLTDILDGIGLSFGEEGVEVAVAPTAATAEFDIVAGQEMAGNLNDANPNDLYRFQGTANSEVTITMRKTNSSSNLDPYLKLYDADGNLLAENDDATVVVAGLDFLDAQITQFTLPADGTYVIEASAYFVPEDGAYTLLVETN